MKWFFTSTVAIGVINAEWFWGMISSTMSVLYYRSLGAITIGREREEIGWIRCYLCLTLASPRRYRKSTLFMLIRDRALGRTSNGWNDGCLHIMQKFWHPGCWWTRFGWIDEEWGMNSCLGKSLARKCMDNILCNMLKRFDAGAT
jgi:hypothetical protein